MKKPSFQPILTVFFKRAIPLIFKKCKKVDLKNNARNEITQIIVNKIIKKRNESAVRKHASWLIHPSSAILRRSIANNLLAKTFTKISTRSLIGRLFREILLQ